MYTSKKYIIYWVLFLTLSSAFTSTLRAIDTDNHGDKDVDKVNVTLDFELVDGLIVVQASCEGLEGNYILDTGAPQLLINQKVRSGDVDLWTTRGQQKGSSIEIASFAYGAIIKEDVTALAMDMTFIEELIGRPVAGILGSDMLKNYSVNIDYEQRELSLIADRAGYTSSMAEYNMTSISIIDYMDDMPIVEMKVDGEKRLLAFDTGAAISVMDSKIELQNSSTRLRTVHINNVHIGDAPFTSFNLSELKTNNSEAVDGILSVTSLNASKVLIDYSSNRIFFFWSKEKSL